MPVQIVVHTTTEGRISRRIRTARASVVKTQRVRRKISTRFILVVDKSVTSSRVRLSFIRVQTLGRIRRTAKTTQRFTIARAAARIRRQIRRNLIGLTRA